MVFCNNLRKGDTVMCKGRRAEVNSQPRESSRNVQVVFEGTNSPRYVDVMETRLIVDGKPEDVPPCDGVPSGKPKDSACLTYQTPLITKDELRELLDGITDMVLKRFFP